MPMTVEYRNGVQSSTISYSIMVIPEGITKDYALIMLWKTPAALCLLISKYREIVGPGNSTADDSRVQKQRTIEYDFLF